MHPLPRVRKMIIWSAAALTVLLLALWNWSMWFGVIWAVGNDCFIAIGAGEIRMQQNILLVGWTVNAPCVLSHQDFIWELMKAGGPSAARWSIAIPLWLPMLAAALTAFIPWRFEAVARRRAHMGLCPMCRYRRTGLAPDRPCPECGAAAPSPTPAAT